MGGMKMTDLDFLRLLPAFMRDDEAVIALSKAMNQLLGEPGKKLDTLKTWDKIDELTEAECDELAWELDIDWYDNKAMGLTEKRETIKSAQQIKSKRGTKWAVERLISAYFGTGYVREWYETDGEPFSFDVLTTNGNISGETFKKFLEAANAAKNERSYIRRVFFIWEQGQPVECSLNSTLHGYEFKRCGTGCCHASNPGTTYSFKDAATGAGYMLYVEGGKLKMESTSGAVTRERAIVEDKVTGKKYGLFVSNGKLSLESSTKTTALAAIQFDDITTGEKYNLFVSSGKLTMEGAGE